MPRHARKQSATGIYHVMARGNNRDIIFHDAEDFDYFIKTLKLCCNINEKNPTSDHTQIYAFCVLNNHFHLLIKEDKNGISYFMKRLMIRYAQYYKEKYEHTGHLFQDRFKSIPVEDEEYLLSAYRYIARNPVEAMICNQPEDYEWSSFSPSRQWTASLPTSYTKEQIIEFVHSSQPETNPFREQISEKEAVRLLVRVAGISDPGDFSSLEKEKQISICRYLRYYGLSIRQISRITRIRRDNIAQWVD